MGNTPPRQYLDDISRDVQDLIYDGRHSEATQLLMDQKGLQKIHAAVEAGRISLRMSEAFPGGASGLSSTEKSKRTSTQKAVVAWALLTLFATVGCGALYYGGRSIIMGAASSKWPSIEGTVKKCEPVRSSSMKKNSTAVVYHAKVYYAFSIDGRTYTGNRYSYGEPTQGSYSSAERARRQFPEGDAIKVYYDPDDPRESVLQAGINWSKSVGWMFVGTILVGITSLVAWAIVAVAQDERDAAERSPTGGVRERS